MAQTVTDDNVVYYCRHCHSLNILVNEELVGEDWDGSYCAKCGSTDIDECSIDDWLKEEQRRKDKRREIEWSK